MKANRKVGELSVTRTHQQRGKIIAADQGAGDFLVDSPGTAVASGSLARAIQPAPYESFRVEVGGSMPCDPVALRDGTTHRELFGILRRELGEQLVRGMAGLEQSSPPKPAPEAPRDKTPHEDFPLRLEDFPPSGTRCSECNAPQFETPDGLQCAGGHGGRSARRGRLAF